jgi:hypothetical protein
VSLFIDMWKDIPGGDLAANIFWSNILDSPHHADASSHGYKNAYVTRIECTKQCCNIYVHMQNEHKEI